MKKQVSIRRRSSRAFLLVDLLFVVALIGFFMLMAAELFSATIAVPRKAESAQNTMLQMDSVLRRMRGDVWAAVAVELDGDRTATLRRADGTQVTWRVGDDGGLSRLVDPAPSATNDPVNWKVRDLRLTFSPADCGVAVHAEMPARHQREEFLMVSQVQLLRREAGR